MSKEHAEINTRGYIESDTQIYHSSKGMHLDVAILLKGGIPNFAKY